MISLKRANNLFLLINKSKYKTRTLAAYNLADFKLIIKSSINIYFYNINKMLKNFTRLCKKNPNFKIPKINLLNSKVYRPFSFKSTNSLNRKLSVGEAAVVLEQGIIGISQVNDLKEYGTVISIGDGIARVFGLLKIQAGEMVVFSSGVKGMALNLETDNVGIVVLGNDREIMEGDVVKRMGSIVDVPIGEEMLGRVLDALGYFILNY